MILVIGKNTADLAVRLVHSAFTRSCPKNVVKLAAVAGSLDFSALEHDILVFVEPTDDVAELIEDELILQLPRQVCFDESCIHKPVMQFYEAGVESQSDLPADRQLPFQGLKELVERNGLAQGDGSEE